MDKMVRFVHCGGFRFDSPEWEGPSAWKIMREKDLWQTFEAVLSLCLTENVDFLFITGDLFDQEHTRKETVERVARSMSRLNEIKIFITPGDQDPLVISSVYRYAEWPENVHIFSERISKIEIRDKDSVIYGSGWTTYHQERSFVENLETNEQSAAVRIMLLHAEVEADLNTENFVPLKIEEITASGLTYLAIGHQNKCSGLQKAGQTYWADCGTAEARSFSENGPHGVILGETNGNTVEINFIELGQRHYIEKILYAASGNSKTEFKNSIAGLVKDINVNARQRDLFRFRLLASAFQDTAALEAVREVIKDEFSYYEVITSEESAAAGKIKASKYKEANASLGFPSLNQVFKYETEERIAEAKQAENKRHWELVQRIGLAAISQAISQEQEAYED